MTKPNPTYSCGNEPLPGDIVEIVGAPADERDTGKVLGPGLRGNLAVYWQLAKERYMELPSDLKLISRTEEEDKDDENPCKKS